MFKYHKITQKCQFGVKCTLLIQKLCKQHTQEEIEFVETISYLEQIPVLLGRIEIEDETAYFIPIRKSLQILTNDNQYEFKRAKIESFQHSKNKLKQYYEAEFNKFNYGESTPYFTILDEFGEIGDFLIESEANLYHEKFLFPKHENKNLENYQKGVYRVLFNNEHVIKNEKNKLVFENENDKNRSFDQCLILYQTVQNRVQVVSIIKNPLFNKDLLGMIGTDHDFSFEERLLMPSDAQLQQRIQQSNKQYFVDGKIFFKSINKKLPIFQVINVKDFLFDETQDIFNSFVTAKFITWNRQSEYPWVQIVETNGSINMIENYQRLILQENNVTSDCFSKDVKKEAQLLIQKLQDDKQPTCINLNEVKDIFIFSIDNKSTKLIDDALSIEIIDKEFSKISVYISDPTSLIQKNSKIYQECKKRLQSCYISSFFQPMLPQILSNQLSLNQGQNRKVFAVSVVIKNGIPFYDTVKIEQIEIKNNAKLSYQNVQLILDSVQNKSETKSQEVIDNKAVKDIGQEAIFQSIIQFNILKSFEIAQQLYMTHKNIGCYLEIDDLEYKDSKMIINQFMILANECVFNYIEQSFEEQINLLNQKKASQKEIIQHNLQIKNLKKNQEKLIKNLRNLKDKNQNLCQEIKNDKKTEKNKERRKQKIFKNKQDNKLENSSSSEQSSIEQDDKIQQRNFQIEQQKITEHLQLSEDNESDEEIKIQQLDEKQLKKLIQEIDDNILEQNEFQNESDKNDKFLTECQIMDSMRSVGYFQNQILKPLNVQIQLTDHTSFIKSKSKICNDKQFNEYTLKYLKFQFRVKDKYIQNIIENNHNKEKQKNNQNQDDLIQQRQKNIKKELTSIQEEKKIRKLKVNKNAIDDKDSSFKKSNQKTQKNSSFQLKEQDKNMVDQSKKQLFQKKEIFIGNKFNQLIEDKNNSDIEQKVHKRSQDSVNLKNQISKGKKADYQKVKKIDSNIFLSCDNQQQLQQNMSFKDDNKNSKSNQKQLNTNQLFKDDIKCEEQIKTSQFSNFPLLFCFQQKDQEMSQQTQQQFICSEFQDSPYLFIFQISFDQNQYNEFENQVIIIDNLIFQLNCKIENLIGDDSLNKNSLQIFDKVIQIQQEKKAKETINKYFQSEQIKFTSPLRRFYDMQIHFYLNNLIKNMNEIQDILYRSNEKNFDVKQYKRKQKKSINIQKQFENLFKDAIIQIKNQKLDYHQLQNQIKTQRAVDYGGTHQSEREINILQLCKQIFTLNSGLLCKALIINIDKFKKRVEVFISVNNIEIQDILILDNCKRLSFKQENKVSLYNKNNRFIEINKFDLCIVSLDCQGQFPLNLLIYFEDLCK